MHVNNEEIIIGYLLLGSKLPLPPANFVTEKYQKLVEFEDIEMNDSK